MSWGCLPKAHLQGFPAGFQLAPADGNSQGKQAKAKTQQQESKDAQSKLSQHSQSAHSGHSRDVHRKSLDRWGLQHEAWQLQPMLPVCEMQCVGDSADFGRM